MYFGRQAQNNIPIQNMQFGLWQWKRKILFNNNYRLKQPTMIIPLYLYRPPNIHKTSIVFARNAHIHTHAHSFNGLVYSLFSLTLVSSACVFYLFVWWKKNHVKRPIVMTQLKKWALLEVYIDVRRVAWFCRKSNYRLPPTNNNKSHCTLCCHVYHRCFEWKKKL